MNALERVRAVLHHERPDQIPFVPYEGLMPRGAFTRELRNRGMGLCTECTPTYWSDWPNVKFLADTEGPLKVETWDTPEGRVSRRSRSYVSRKTASNVVFGHFSIRREVLREGLIKGIDDYAPVVFVIDDEHFNEDHVNYDYTVRDFREDCLVRVAGLRIPYDTSYDYFGKCAAHGYENWVYAQADHPEQFANLLEALERREARRFRVIAESPGEVMVLRGLGGWYGPWYGPQQFEAHDLPFFKEYVPRLHEKDRLLSLKADTIHLAAFKDLIPETGVDIVEGFTPPPVGDLSVADARAAWGDEMIIWVNFPESVFLEGAEATKQYTLNLLHSDPTGHLVMGMTVMGMSMIANEETARIFKDGMWAILDAIEAFGVPS